MLMVELSGSHMWQQEVSPPSRCHVDDTGIITYFAHECIYHLYVLTHI